MARYFTLAEAEALLPIVTGLLRQAVALKARYIKTTQELQAAAERVAFSGGAVVDVNQVLQWRARREAASARLNEIAEEVQSHGCLIKDLDVGLLDFPTLYRDREVYLCYRLDEPGIRFWHGVDEGYRGRKPIDQEFLEHHGGDANH